MIEFVCCHLDLHACGCAAAAAAAAGHDGLSAAAAAAHSHAVACVDEQAGLDLSVGTVLDWEICLAYAGAVAAAADLSETAAAAADLHRTTDMAAVLTNKHMLL